MDFPVNSRFWNDLFGELLAIQLYHCKLLTLHLQAGSNSSISDLTAAGGWTIIDCNATSSDQEIRVVCHDPSKCNHLHMNGAENTVVRLPDDVSVFQPEIIVLS